MANQSKTEFIIKFLAKISACYQNFVVNEHSASEWLDGLSGLHKEDILRAFSEYKKTNIWPPTIADIRQKAAIYTRNRMFEAKNKLIQLPDLTDQERVANKRKVFALLENMGGKK